MQSKAIRNPKRPVKKSTSVTLTVPTTVPEGKPPTNELFDRENG
jgi:hypothetical protein